MFSSTKTSLILAAVLLCSAALARAQYRLTFNDEFNQFDQKRWQTADFWGMRNNGGDYQGQWFADPVRVPAGVQEKPYNAFVVNDGTLTIRAQPTPPDTFSGAGQNMKSQPYVSGQLTTAHKFTQRYGYFELRAKLPPGKGLWSRFWLLTDDGNWPGEYDVFEVLGKSNPVVVHQTTHYRDETTKHGVDGSAYKGINPVDGEFHTYGFHWTPKTVTWYVDGVATLKQANRINIPMYVLLDLAVGNDPGNLWPGNPDKSTPWPADLVMDYIRVYSDDPALPAVTPDAGYTPSVLPEGLKLEEPTAKAVLPDGWKAQDIGAPELSGSSTWNPRSGAWMLKGAGFGIGGYGDQCQFAGTALTGDGSITATVEDVSVINSNVVTAGVMMRESTDQRASEISLLYTVARDKGETTTGLTLQSRNKATEKASVLQTVPNVKGPVSLRLTRSGDAFTAEYSTDAGVSWTRVGEAQTVAMGPAAQAGLAISGNQSNYRRLSRADFSGVSVAAAAAKPAADAGTVGGPSAYTLYAGTATITRVAKTDAADANKGTAAAGYEVWFSYTPREEVKDASATAYLDRFKEHSFHLCNGWYAGPEFIKKYGLATGKQFNATMKVLKSGTSTPIILSLDGVVDADYFEAARP